MPGLPVCLAEACYLEFTYFGVAEVRRTLENRV